MMLRVPEAAAAQQAKEKAEHAHELEAQTANGAFARGLDNYHKFQDWYAGEFVKVGPQAAEDAMVSLFASMLSAPTMLRAKAMKFGSGKNDDMTVRAMAEIINRIGSTLLSHLAQLPGVNIEVGEIEFEGATVEIVKAKVN